MHRTRTMLVVDPRQLELARVAKGLLRREVCELAGISRTAGYHAFTTGRVGIKVARAIAGVLGLDLAELWIDRGPVRHG